MGKLGPLLPPAWQAVDMPSGIHTVADLRDWLSRELPELGLAFRETPVKVIVNLSAVHDLQTGIHAGDDIAFLPPMSGG
jgi:molybdopterin converting factor small subunit